MLSQNGCYFNFYFDVICNLSHQYAHIFCTNVKVLLLSHFYLHHYKYLSSLLNIHQPRDQFNDPTVRYNLQWGKYFGVSLGFTLCVSVDLSR